MASYIAEAMSIGSIDSTFLQANLAIHMKVLETGMISPSQPLARGMELEP